MDARLFKFLLDNNALVVYKKNLEKFNNKSMIKELNSIQNQDNVLDMSFNWSNTVQGFDYWCKLDEKYREYLKSFKNEP